MEKTAINHIGTSTFLKEDIPYQLPIETQMKPRLGIGLMVLKLCAEHSHNRYLVKGIILLIPEAIDDSHLVNHNFLHEQYCISSSFLWPEICWEIVFMS